MKKSIVFVSALLMAFCLASTSLAFLGGLKDTVGKVVKVEPTSEQKKPEKPLLPNLGEYDNVFDTSTAVGVIAQLLYEFNENFKRATALTVFSHIDLMNVLGLKEEALTIEKKLKLAFQTEDVKERGAEIGSLLTDSEDELARALKATGKTDEVKQLNEEQERLLKAVNERNSFVLTYDAQAVLMGYYLVQVTQQLKEQAAISAAGSLLGGKGGEETKYVISEGLTTIPNVVTQIKDQIEHTHAGNKLKDQIATLYDVELPSAGIPDLKTATLPEGDTLRYNQMMGQDEDTEEKSEIPAAPEEAVDDKTAIPAISTESGSGVDEAAPEAQGTAGADSRKESCD